MNDCKRVRDDLKAYLDGQLPPAARLAARLHLARCASCRKEMKAMEQIGHELREDAGVLDAGLRARILAGVPAGAPPAPEGPVLVSKRRRKPMLFWGAAAAAVISWFAFYPLFARLQGASMPSYSRMNTPATPPAATMIVAHPQAMAPQGRGAGGFAGSVAGDAGEAVVGAPAPKAAGREMNNYVAVDKVVLPQSVTAPRRAGRHEIDPGFGGFRSLTNVNPGTSPETPLPAERQVHKEAEITLQVDQIEQRSDEVEQMVNSAGGFVVNNELSTGDDNVKSASLTTKVPIAKFDSVLSRLSRLGEVKAKHVTGEDVTERLSDQEQATRVVRDDIAATRARLHTKQDPLEREIDQQNLEDLKIRVAQEQARLDLYRKLAALATITVDLHEKPKTGPAPQTSGFLDEMNDTAHAAVHSFLQAARLPVLLLIWLLAYAPVWILLVIAYRYAFRS